MGSQIHPSAVIDSSAQVGDNVIIGPNCVIDAGVVLGDGNELDANVSIGKDVVVGKNNRFFACCAIGRPPQMLNMTKDTKYGKIRIGSGNTIREQVTIHPSIYPDRLTVIGDSNFLMTGVHIGHDCVLEDQIVLSNYCQIGGHCKIGQGVWMSGMAAAHQFVTLGKWCYAAGLSGITHDIPPFVIVSGHYPCLVRSVNERGLNRSGMTEDQKATICEAFKNIYRHDDGVFIERVKKYVGQDNLDENVKCMVDFILRSNQHRFGRYLETFRD